MPLAPIAFLTTLLHVFLAVRLLPALAQATGAWPVFALLLLLSAVTMPLPFLRRLPLPDVLRAPVRWVGLLAMGWFSSVFVLAVLRDVGLLSAWAVTRLADLSMDRASWEQGSALAVMALATADSLVGLFFARRTPPVRRVEVPIAGLPARLAGFTIAQLSDLHVGPTIRAAHIARIVEEVNRLGADMVAITGDLVDGSVDELRAHVAPLARLRARHGTFVVTGNHEYYAGAHAWIDELRRLGLKVLLNEHVVLQTRSVHGAQTDEEILDSALLVAGVTDYTAGHFDAAHESDPQEALRDAPPMVATRILLAHQPRSAPAAAEAGFQLQLSGHTHGGQFFPWNLFVPLQQPFTAGLHRLQDMWVYVSRGTGYWGPPKRLGAPSEITLVTLRRADD